MTWSEANGSQDVELLLILRLAGGGGEQGAQMTTLRPGRLISQYIHRDYYYRGTWTPQAKLEFDAYIIDSIEFERLYGIELPPLLIELKTYYQINLPYFRDQPTSDRVHGSFHNVRIPTTNNRATPPAEISPKSSLIHSFMSRTISRLGVLLYCMQRMANLRRVSDPEPINTLRFNPSDTG